MNTAFTIFVVKDLFDIYDPEVLGYFSTRSGAEAKVKQVAEEQSKRDNWTSPLDGGVVIEEIKVSK